MPRLSLIAKISSNFNGDYWSNVAPWQNQSTNTGGGVDCKDDLSESGNDTLKSVESHDKTNGFGDDCSGKNSKIRRLIAKVNDHVLCDEYLNDSGVVPVAKKARQALSSSESDDGSVVLPSAKKARAPKTKSES
eukprot:1042967-Ditylum_brightwellii.AAC.1